ncbi:MAG: hypothetical protein V3V08_10965 [Nannocystaceae bacterium]
MSVEATPPDPRWAALRDSDVQGEYLTPEDRQFLARHEPSDPSLVAECDLFRALSQWGGMGGDPSGDTLADTRLATAALQQFSACGPLVLGCRRLRRSLQRVPAPRAAAIVTAAAAAVALFWVQADVANGPHVSASSTRAARLLPNTDATAGSVVGDGRVGTAAAGPGSIGPSGLSGLSFAEDQEPVLVASGSVHEGGRKLVSGDVVRVQGRELIADDGACFSQGAAIRFCLSPGSRGVLAADGAGTGIRLVSGQADVQQARSVTRTSTFHVVVAGVRFESRSRAASYTVETFSAPGGWRVSVDESEQSDELDETVAVAVAGPQGEIITSVPGGFQFSRGDAQWRPSDTGSVRGRVGGVEGTDSRGAVASSARTFPATSTLSTSVRSRTAMQRRLAQARELRAAGRYRAAARVYERLTKAHRDVPLARATLVSLGQLYMGPLQAPSKALRAFDRYLSESGGVLAEEARYGRIEVLGTLGRKAAERRAMEEFLDEHPSSSYAARVRHRLQ